MHPAVSVAALIAVLIVVAGATWLGLQNSALRTRIAALEARRVEVENQGQALRQHLIQQSPRIPDAQKAPSGPERPALLASLVFLPGATRSQTRVQQLALTSDVQLVHIEFQLEPRDDFPQYRAELRTRSGAEVLVRSSLTGRRANSAYSVSFDLPASALTTGEYELALKGLSDSQTTDIGYYDFRVQKR
jgi:hypothetical protein